MTSSRRRAPPLTSSRRRAPPPLRSPPPAEMSTVPSSPIPPARRDRRMGEAGQDMVALAVKEEEMGFPAWAQTIEECEARFGVDKERGLSSSKAAARLCAHGPNELTERPGPTKLQLIAQQFEDTLVWIILAAAAISFTLA